MSRICSTDGNVKISCDGIKLISCTMDIGDAYRKYFSSFWDWWSALPLKRLKLIERASNIFHGYDVRCVASPPTAVCFIACNWNQSLWIPLMPSCLNKWIFAEFLYWLWWPTILWIYRIAMFPVGIFNNLTIFTFPLQCSSHTTSQPVIRENLIKKFIIVSFPRIPNSHFVWRIIVRTEKRKNAKKNHI